MREERGAALEDLADEQATRTVPIPRLVLVESATEFEIDGRTVEACRVLGWNAERLVVQDLDWDHLPIVGWAVVGEHVEAVTHEKRRASSSPSMTNEPESSASSKQVVTWRNTDFRRSWSAGPS